MKVYLAGPMSGYADCNRAAFVDAAKELRNKGLEVVSPVELNSLSEMAHNQNWAVFMKRDIKHLVDCDGVTLLDGWEKSKGASLEAHIAWNLGMPVYRWSGDQLYSIAEWQGKVGDLSPEQELRPATGSCADSKLNVIEAPAPLPLCVDSNPKDVVKSRLILDEAKSLVYGIKEKTYGSPQTNHERTALLWSAFLKATGHEVEIRPEWIPWFNILQKVSRSIHKLTRDILVDVAGYAENLARMTIYEEREDG